MPNINLWATEGYISTPDGKSIYCWGFSKMAGDPAQIPGPIIIVKQSAPPALTAVTVNLTNNLSEPVSLLFPGQKEVKVNGQPVQPQYQNGTLVSLTNHALPGETITYSFTAESPGTFLYESGTNPHKQVQMGLYGTIIIRPPDYIEGDSSYQTAYGAGTDTEFDREYILAFSEIDPDLHQAVEMGEPYEVRAYRPRYWTINGRCAEDTLQPDVVAHLPNQPYSSLILMEPGEKILIRYAGSGIENHPMHPHGNHTRLVGMDGRLLRNQQGQNTWDLSHKRFTVLTGAGQTYDQIFTWTGLGIDPNNNPIPTNLPNIRNMAIGTMGMTMWSGSPYLGEKGDLPPGVVSHNSAGEYYFMLHSHAEPEITNWAAFPGGLMTSIGVFPVGTLGTSQGRLPTQLP
jgi:manganese oxidase